MRFLDLRFKTAALMLSLLFTAASNAKAATSFGNPTNYPVGTTPRAVVTGDFNRDGRLDLAAANSGSNTVSILLGNLDGTFQAAVNYSVGLDPVSIVVVDLNNDKTLDLAVAFHGDQSSAQTGGVSLLLGSGNGTFQAATTLASTSYPTSIGAGDFNIDGKADLAVSDFDAPVSVFLGNGDGTFHAAVNYNVTGDASFVVVGDFNSDNKPDLAVTTQISLHSEQLDGKASVLLGKGDGSFLPAVETSLGGAAWSGAVGDFNGDQKLDLAFIIKPTSVFGVTAEAIALGNGGGTFGSPQIIGGADFATSVMVNDLNEDRVPDVVGFSYPVTHALHIFLGLGDGTFHQPETLVFSSFGPGGIAMGDFNGDGLADLAVTMDPQNVVSIFLNTTVDFALSLSDLAPLIVRAGQSATSTVMTTAANGFTGSVSFTCSVQPTPTLAPQCSISPSSLNPGTPATLTITTQAPQAALASPFGSSGLLYAIWMPIFGAAFAGACLCSRQRFQRKLDFLLCCMLLAGLLFQAACGGSSTSGRSAGISGTPKGQYTITLTGVAGSTQHSAGVTLTVQ